MCRCLDNEGTLVKLKYTFSCCTRAPKDYVSCDSKFIKIKTRHVLTVYIQYSRYHTYLFALPKICGLGSGATTARDPSLTSDVDPAPDLLVRGRILLSSSKNCKKNLDPTVL